MILRQTDWTLKLHAFLHDPFEKPLILFSERHTVRAEELTNFLQLPPLTSEMRQRVHRADHYAAATNRLVVETAQTRHPVDFMRHPVVIHPLSGQVLDLSEVGGSLAMLDEAGLDRVVQGAKAIVEEQLRDLAGAYDHDHQRLFLALWRLLPERLRRAGQRDERLGSLWSLLPADSRVPDHSIWDHLSTTSAMVAALEQPAFLLFTMGPVQEFIATARRTQDLWAGSFLLSYLTWQGIRVVADHLGPDNVIFPSLYAQPLADFWLHSRHRIEGVRPAAEQLGQPSLPNRFLALVPSSKAVQLAEEARAAVIGAWHEIVAAVKQLIETRMAGEKLPTDSLWNQLWQRHRDSCFEMYWVALPWGTDPSQIMADYKRWLGIGGEREFERVVKKFADMRSTYLSPGTLYAPLYDLTERVLGSRKALRGYQAAVEGGHKCTLCGIREALHPGTSSGYAEIGTFWHRMAEVFRGDFRPEGQERLCAVCLTKRLAVDAYLQPRYGIEAAFPSTSTIAVERFRREILERADELNGTLNALAIAFQHVSSILQLPRARPVPKTQSLGRRADLAPLVRIDGRWFFKEGYATETLAREYGDEILASPAAREAVEAAQGRLQALLSTAAKLGIAQPSTYYAVVYMDGDRMGEWLSGEHEQMPRIRQVLHPKVREALQTAWQEIMEARRPLAPSLHTAVSTALRAFSQEVVRPVVEAHCGVLVYAGGDDVIAFFPIRNVLAAVWDLRRLYAGDACQVEGFRASRGFARQGQDLWPMLGTAATASAGIAIAHHLQPLSQVLAAARDAEQVAKKAFGRNAFAVYLLKRSGERLVAGARYMYDRDTASIEILQHVIGALRGEGLAKLSSRLMYQLAHERILGILGPEAWAAQEAELQRLINRHVEPKNAGEKEAAATLIEQLTQELTQLLQAIRRCHLDLGHWKDAGLHSPFELFSNLLLLARFIAMEGHI